MDVDFYQSNFDVDSIRDSKNEIGDNTKTIIEITKEVGVEFNTGKTKYMVTSQNGVNGTIKKLLRYKNCY